MRAIAWTWLATLVVATTSIKSQLWTFGGSMMRFVHQYIPPQPSQNTATSLFDHQQQYFNYEVGSNLSIKPSHMDMMIMMVE